MSKILIHLLLLACMLANALINTETLYIVCLNCNISEPQFCIYGTKCIKSFKIPRNTKEKLFSIEVEGSCCHLAGVHPFPFGIWEETQICIRIFCNDLGFGGLSF